MSHFITLFLVAAMFLSSSSVSAQEIDNSPPVPNFPSLEAAGPLQCFDYYDFGSVEADLQSNIAQTVPGAVLAFSGPLTNNNAYPLVDGKLYAKIFKKDETTFAEGDGNLVVDQFVVEDNVSIPANGYIQLSYEWTVPMNAEGGEYYVAYFFATNDRYNLMGLSFTDDVVGNIAPFTVVSDNTVAKISKADTNINGRNHHFAAVPLSFSATETVAISTTITNPNNETITIPLQWNQYAWDAMNPNNRRNTKTEVITLQPNETKEINYITKEQREPVVYVVALTEDRGVKSILNIRFIRDDVDETRINFPGITQFPLAQDVETTVFACAHSTNLPAVEDNTLTLTLTDKAGSLIHEYTYEGFITGSMGGFGNTFRPQKNYNHVFLNAKLERQGVVIEEVQIEYDCTNIPDTECLPETPEDTPSSVTDIITNPLFFFPGIAVLLLLLFLVWSVHKRHNIGPKISGDMTTPMSLFAILFLPAALLFFVPNQAEAKSTQWNWVDSSGTYYYASGWFGYQPYNWPPSEDGGGFVPALTNPNYTITYTANVYNNDTSALISDGSSIPVGTNLRFEPKPFESADIFWFGTGDSYDSPNGYWRSGATAPQISPNERNISNYGTGRQAVGTTLACAAQDYVGSKPANTGGNWDIHIPLSVQPPTVTVNHSGTAGLSCSAGNTLCTVTSPGTINTSFVFGATYGKLYYRYKSTGSYTVGNYEAGSNCSPPGVRSPGVEPCQFTVQAGACFGDNQPLRKGCTSGTTCSGVPDYQLQVPQRQINYTLTVPGPANQAPNTPTITGPTTGQVSVTNTFTVTGTDSDGDTLRYGVTTAACSSVSQWLPSSGYVNSGTSQNLNRTWNTANTYTIYVLAEDSNGARSGCASHTITISPAPPTTADLTINGSNGPLAVNKNTNLAIAWNSANASACTLYGAGLSGGGVALTGNTSISSNAISSSPESYILTCDGVSDSVSVTVQNRAPNAPAITGPTTGITGTTYAFSFTATDPDNDQIFYEIDWDNNGTVDATTPASSYVNSGTTLNGNRSWSSANSYTFRARTVDFDNARSGWTSHTINLNPGAPTVTAEANVNGGSWSTSDRTINPGDVVKIRWVGTDATSCSTNFGGGSSTDTRPSGVDVTEPVYGSPSTYTVDCSNVTGSNSDSITITMNGQPDLEPLIGTPIPSNTLTAAGEFTAVTVTFDIANTGTANASASDYRFIFETDPDGDGVFTSLADTTASAGSVGNGSQFRYNNFVINNVPAGNYRMTLRADTTDSVNESNEGNNERVATGAFTPLDPGLEITADKQLVRRGETTTLRWTIDNNYSGMMCQVTGQGVDTGDFAPGTLTNTPTQAIEAKVEFTLSCTVGSFTFTDNVTVEALGEAEEV